jgi:hypothetical protein
MAPTMTSSEDRPRNKLEADAGPPPETLSLPAIADEAIIPETVRSTGSGLKYEFVDSE